jgi:NhaP-type Na+/H+ or K+/H+ antiporter
VVLYASAATDPRGGVIVAAATGGPNLIAIVAAIIAIGVIAQVLSDRFRIPSVVFLILAGVVLGPEGLGVVGPDAFGNALGAIVGLSVAIIVFEGAFHLRIENLREAPRETLKLITIGAAIALVGTAAAVHYLLGASWDVAFLIGALLVATGPTVVSPILEVVPTRDRVEVVLETEGIVNDVTAAIIAVVVFEAIRLGNNAPGELLALFAERLGTGILVGGLVAVTLYYALQYVDLSPGSAPRNARLLVLAGALVAYGTADTIATEAGVAAVATAGVVLGNLGVPYEDEISAFKGDITLIVLSFVFIALAALLQFDVLAEIGLRGLAVAGVVALLLRPLLVFVSTTGDRFTTGERWFMSLVGPRGIIPASVATLFAIELRNTGQAAAADLVVGTVFLVILVTVVFEGGFARRIAEYLDIIPMRILIIGGGKVGRSLARSLEGRGENVVIVEENQEIVQRARNDGFTVHHGDGTDTDVLRSAGIANARIVVGATGDDDVNLLVSQLARSKFDPETILARVNDPDNTDAFEELGVRAISATLATAQAMDNYIERPSMMGWMAEIGHTGEIQEVDVTSEELIGRTVREVGPELPEDSLIALIQRDDETKVPGPDLQFQRGDRLTIIGGREEVHAAIEYVHPDT